MHKHYLHHASPIGTLKIQAGRSNLHATFRSPGNREHTAKIIIGIGSSVPVSASIMESAPVLPLVLVPWVL